MKLNNKNIFLGFFSGTMGFATAYILVEGLKRAGKNLNRQRLINALENLKNWDSGFFPPITFGRDDHAGVESVMLLQLQGGKQVEISDWLN